MACDGRGMRAVVLATVVLAGACTPDEPAGQGTATSGTSATTTSATTTSATTTSPGPGGCPSQPGRLAAEGSGRLLLDIQMVSARRGWAVGDSLILTTDDGVHWVPQYSGSGVFVAVNAIDSLHAWAVGEAQLLGTSDGGRNWNQLGEPQDALRSVHFFDTDRGFGIAGWPRVVSDDGLTGGRSLAGTVVRTRDGGRTWEPVAAPCDAQAVCFTAPEDGWLLAGRRVYRSEDDGRTWREVFALPENKPDIGILQCARAGGAWVMYAGADGALGHQAYIVYHSDDGGRNWNVVMVEGYTNQDPTVVAPQAGSYPGPFSVLSPAEAVFVGYTPSADEPAAVLTATEGGRVLSQSRPIPVAGYGPRAASFVSRLRGWVVGAAGASDLLMATTDGGRTWDTQRVESLPVRGR